MGERFLVTGAAGFIGYHRAEALSRRPGASVFCVDNFIRGEADAAFAALVERPNVEFLEHDLTLATSVEALPDGIHTVFHMAALNGTQNFYDRPFDVVRHSTIPTLLLLEKYAAACARRFIYAGTSEAYASIVTRFNWEVPTAEDVPLGIEDPINPRWSYAASKLHGEAAVFAACHQSGLSHSVLRYHNVYGPRMGDKHVVPDFLMRARGGEYVLYGADDTRAFMFINDAVEATLRAAESSACAGEIINIGSAREIRIGELGELMMGIGGWHGRIDVHPAPKGSVRRRVPDTQKLTRLTGFQERWTLEEGLRETAAYYIDSAAPAGITAA